MGTGLGLNEPTTGAGLGPGWTRLAEAVAKTLPPSEVDGVWVFPNIRREGREWGTAVLTRAEGERRRIYTARYMLVLKGEERGQFEAEVEEVGSGTVATLSELLQDVHKRTDDEHPPVPLAPADWFPPSEAPAPAGPDADHGSPR
jgi:hypothetical protein